MTRDEYRAATISYTQILNESMSSKRAIAYFFCSFTAQQSQEPLAIFGSMLLQLLEANPIMWRSIDDRYRNAHGSTHQAPKKLELFEIIELIVQCSREIPEVFLFLDAPNESKESTKILRCLLQLLQNGRPIRVLMSSTEELSTSFEFPLAEVVRMDQKETADDITAYINAWLEYGEDFSDLPELLKEDIRSTLQGRAGGMYSSFSPRSRNDRALSGS